MQVLVAVRLLPLAAFHAQGHARGVQLGGGVEQFQQVVVGVHALGLGRVGLVQLGQDPLLQARKVDVEEVVVPVNGLRRPRQKGAFLDGQPVAQGADVVRTQDVGVVQDEGPEQVDVLARLLGDSLDLVDLLLDAVDSSPKRPPAQRGRTRSSVLDARSATRLTRGNDLRSYSS